MGKKGQRQSDTKHALGNLATQLALFPLSIVATLVSTRLLGPENRGLYVFVLMLGNVILPVCFLGTGNAIIYLKSSGRYESNRSWLNVNCIALVSGLVTVSLIGTLVFLEKLGATAAQLDKALLNLALVSIVFESLYIANRYFLVGHSAFGWVNKLRFARALSLHTATIIVACLFDAPLVPVCWVLYSTQISFGFMAAYLSLRLSIRSGSLGWSRGYFKEAYHYGIKAWIGNVSNRANDQLDQWLLALVSSPENLGLYSAAVSFANLLKIPSNALAPVLFNRIAAGLAERKDGLDTRAQSLKLVAQIHRPLFWLLSFVAIGIGGIGIYGIGIVLGAQFQGAWLPFVILLPGTLFYYVTRTLIQKYFGASGRPEINTSIQVVGATVGLAAYLWLIPIYGITGAALGTSIAYMASTGFALGWLYRETRQVSVRVNMFGLNSKDAIWFARRLGLKAKHVSD